MYNIHYLFRFLKVGQSPKSTIQTSDNDSDEQNDLNPGSWRQAIFKNVVTPNKQSKGSFNLKVQPSIIDIIFLLIRYSKCQEEVRCCWFKSIVEKSNQSTSFVNSHGKRKCQIKR